MLPQLIPRPARRRPFPVCGSSAKSPVASPSSGRRHRAPATRARARHRRPTRHQRVPSTQPGSSTDPRSGVAQASGGANTSVRHRLRHQTTTGHATPLRPPAITTPAADPPLTASTPAHTAASSSARVTNRLRLPATPDSNVSTATAQHGPLRPDRRHTAPALRKFPRGWPTPPRRRHPCRSLPQRQASPRRAHHGR